jgi:uncharacterized membrane protein YgdD (TMEM256/DUF423 family)
MVSVDARMKPCLLLASILGLTAVALGALGAHALRGILSTEALDAFRTATQYQLIHAVSLVALGFGMKQGLKGLRPVMLGWGFGVILFSGSIYLLTCHPLLGLPKWRWLGPVTPLGGLLMLGGWIALLVAAFRHRSPD